MQQRRPADRLVPLPQTDHPVIPQNLYRMSGGADNTERFEQIGQSWMKHTFLALQDIVCGSCNQSPPCNPGPQLCPGCSDPYVSGLNGDQDQIGSRAWVNPFTGSFPSNANDHTGHVHAPTDSTVHRILVQMTDLIPGGNPGASYFGEAAYISPHEYTWCQLNPGQCNMFNNFSYRQFSVTGGPTNFSFPPVGSTVRMQPAIQAWVATGATVNQVEPDPGNDGMWFMGYKVTNPSAGVWHYQYALFNMNLDRAIQSFTVPLAAGVNVSNIGFHAPPQQPGQPHDGTQGDAGFSSAPWDVTQDTSSITWSTETFATNQNANAIRWGTLYNFRFDADAPPQSGNATVGFFKTGSPMTVEIQAPGRAVVAHQHLHQRQVQPLQLRPRRRRGPLPRLVVLRHPGNAQHRIRVRHRSGETSAINFARSALEVRWVLASLQNIFCGGSRAGCDRLDFAGDLPLQLGSVDYYDFSLI